MCTAGQDGRAKAGKTLLVAAAASCSAMLMRAPSTSCPCARAIPLCLQRKAHRAARVEQRCVLETELHCSVAEAPLTVCTHVGTVESGVLEVSAVCNSDPDCGL